MSKKKSSSNIDKIMEGINKSHGDGTVMRLGDNPIVEVETYSTGSFGLNRALGIGGFPKGRIIEVYGPESSGKTTLTIHAIADCQRKGGTAVMIDAEHAFDKAYAKNLGVDIEKLIICQPDFGEQALEVAENLISSGEIDLVVIDSVAALTPRSEIEGEMGDSKVGLHARLMSQALRKMVGTVSKNNCCCIFINQLREKIGVMFGNPETTTGGNALKFYSSIRLDIRKIGAPHKTKDDNIIGNNVKVKVAKNKLAPPFKVVNFDIMYGAGISKSGEIIDHGVAAGIINKAGSWYSYEDTKIGQGRDAVKQFLEDNPELMEEIEKKIAS